jgi:transcriptional regulator NrdR family protein
MNPSTWLSENILLTKTDEVPMECPECGYINSQVIDSRLTNDRISIRRRRQCLGCSERFTTYETTEERMLPVLIQKKAGHGATLFKFQTMLSFLSETLKILSMETTDLTRRIKQYEKTEAVRIPKSKAGTRTTSKKKTYVKKTVARKAGPPSATNAVLKVINRHKKGVDIPRLKAKTGFDDKKIRNILYRETKLGKIKRKGRGIYIYS